MQPSRIFIRLSPVALLLLLFSSPTRLEAQEFRVVDEGDRRIAINTGGPRFPGELFRLEVERILIQEEDREAALLFGPRNFVIDEAGYAYVADSRNHRLAVFDPAGRYVRSFGSEGEGPGAFRELSIQAFLEGVLYIHDYSLNRTTLLRTDGSLVDLLTTPPTGRIRAYRHPRPGGGMIVLTSQEDMRDGHRWAVVRAALFDAAGDTITVLSCDPADIATYVEFYNADGSFQSRTNAYTLYAGFPQAGYHPATGIVLVNGQVPEFDIYRPDRLLDRHVVLDLPPEPVSRAEIRQHREMMEQRIQERTGRQREMAEASLEARQWRRTRAFWEGLIFDDAGNIWLQVVEESARIEENGFRRLFDLISPEGEHLGRTRLPGDCNSMRITRGYVCTIEHNRETDEAIPTIYRLIPQVEGLVYP